MAAVGAAESGLGSAKAKWGLPLLLLLATTLNYLDRQTMGILAPVIQKQMGFDNEALGWLFSIFYYAYMFSQFGVGLALDRYNLRWLYGLAVLAWSAACGLTGLAAGFYGLMAFRLLLGVMESANWPAAMRMISRLLPPADRPLGNGIFTSGTSIGALIAPACILGINETLGWRWAFAAVGAVGAAWVVLWVRFTGSPRLAAVWTGTSCEPGLRVYAGILRCGQFWRVFAVTMLVNPCIYFNLNWLPTYFVQQRGLDAGRTLGWILTLIYFGLDLGYLACGAAALWLARLGWGVRSARRIVFFAASALQLAAAAVPFLAGLRGAVAALVVVNFAIGVWVAMYLTMAQEVSEANVGTAAGLLGGSGSLAGAVAMWGVGRVTARTASFAIPMVAVAGAGVLLATAGLSVTRARPAVAAGAGVPGVGTS